MSGKNWKRLTAGLLIAALLLSTEHPIVFADNLIAADSAIEESGTEEALTIEEAETEETETEETEAGETQETGEAQETGETQETQAAEETPSPEEAEGENRTEESEPAIEASQTEEAQTAGTEETEVTEEAPETEALTPEAAGEEKPEQEEPLDLTGVLTVEELGKLGETEVGAAWELRENSQKRGLFRMAAGSGWSFDAYYVNQEDPRHVEKTGDFNLKYQMEFHTNETLLPGAVEIRLPAALFTDRNGTAIRPSELGVPMGTPEDWVVTRSSPFNYRIEEETGDLIFFNYREIPAGSNAAWQVLYRNLPIMEIVDETTWELRPRVTVTIEEEEETRETEPLTGHVNSKASLTGVTKKPYFATGKSYTPGLYTKEQVKAYIDGALPAEFEEHFEDYRYLVWDVQIKGNATQPWKLQVWDKPAFAEGGKGDALLVGYKNNPTSGYGTELGKHLDLTGEAEGEGAVLRENGKEKSWGSRLFVVTAYPNAKEGDVLTNRVGVTLTPADGVDPVSYQEADASFSCVDYAWDYDGDGASLEKGKTETYKGWLKAFAQQKEGFDTLPFTVTGRFRGYGMTHNVGNEDQQQSGAALGERIPGKSYRVTTVDDFLYAFPGGETPDASHMLSGEDYYFTSVQITQKDTGYDIWEDKTAAPEQAEDVDQDLKIYVMNRDSNEWTFVKSVPWNEAGMSCTLSEAELAGEPWRVKAEHESINYATECQMELSVCLRPDSPRFEKIIGEDTALLQVENLAGLYIEELEQQADGTKTVVRYVQDDGSMKENYKEPGLKDATLALYQDEAGNGFLPMRKNAVKTLTGLSPHAASYKTVKTTNDAANSRLLADYCLTAYDGYEVYSQAAVEALKQIGVESPGRAEVMFCDLLPYGMKFDPSVPVRAGRITSLSGTAFQNQPASWDKSQVSVTMDTGKDVVEDWNGTGRTLLRFHLRYEGADPAVFTNGQWMEGFGVSFRAYSEWENLELAEKADNISAYLPEAGDTRPLCGTELEVFPDDGISYPNGTGHIYGGFGTDLNGDGETQVRNVLYAHAGLRGDAALANESGIRKLVRADSDRFGVFQESAVVETAGTYTYEITVSNGAGDPLKDVVVYDHLEQAAADRKEDVTDPFQKDFTEQPWEGTFLGLDLKGLTDRGIAPKVYYSEKRDARISDGTEKPEEVLTEANGWYLQQAYLDAGKELCNVKAVAVDLSTCADETTPFLLGEMKSVSFRVRMQAPEGTDAANPYAFNNPAFYSCVDTENPEDSTAHTVEGDSVRVALEETAKLILEKRFAGEVPEQAKNTAFSFYLYETVNGKKVPFANREYQLYTLTDEGYVQQTEVPCATDGNGRLSLFAGQRAVFTSLPDVSRVEVKEQESPFWETETEEEVDDETGDRVITVTNAYRPVLYVQKYLAGAPADLDETAQCFTFMLETKGKDGSWKPLANAEFWYVDSVRIDGGAPAKVSTPEHPDGMGRTGADGTFEIRKGEILALFPGAVGTDYRLSETGGAGDGTDWYCQTSAWEGTVPVLGGTAGITNIYKWKELYLTKSLTHQDPADCTQEFTFRVGRLVDGEEVPLSGNAWVLLDENEQETETRGTLESGCFTCACAGRMVRISGLEAGETYLVTETDSGELYTPVNGGTAEVEMPIYSSKNDVTLTNDYQLRSLSVKKLVAYDPSDASLAEEVKSAEFKLHVEMRGEPLCDYPYQLFENGRPVESFQTDGSGTFVLKHNQTAVFTDVGRVGDAFVVTELLEDGSPFRQIYPAEDAPQEGQLETDGSSVTFVNGTEGNLLLEKSYVGADQEGSAYVENMKANTDEGKALREKHAVTLTLTVTDEAGETYVWPRTDETVTLVDAITGETDAAKPWSAGSSMKVNPWQTLVIPASKLTGAVSYRLTEDAEDQHRIFALENGAWMEIRQEEPAQDQGAGGSLGEHPVAEIVNAIQSLPPTSEIWKRMSMAPVPVPTGAVLVWRVERYTGAGFEPAEGIAYVTMDEAGPTTDRTLRTEADGRITLTKTEHGYPGVRFPEDRVVLKVGAQPAIGTLRLVEVWEESDGDWGLLAGYDSAEKAYGGSLAVPGEEAVTFVNSNRPAPVEIEKQMDEPSDAVFTMFLRQVLEASADPITSEEEILSSAARGGIAYTVYDSESGSEAGSGVTGKNGEIRLKAGQYARLYLPDNTWWTVSEELRADCTLESLAGTPDRTTSLGDNLMLIHPKADVKLTLEASTERPYFTAGEVLNRDDFAVYLGEPDGSRRKLSSGDFTLEPESIPADRDPGSMEITVRWKDGNLTAAVPVTVIGTISITFGMTSGTTPIYDVETGEKIDFTSGGEVTIPEFVRYQNKICRVTGMDSYTFQFGAGVNVTKLILPDSITVIKSNTFLNSLTLEEIQLPEHLTSIGESAFLNCEALKQIVIPDGVTTIGSYAFQNCVNLTSVQMPAGVTKIEDYTFMGCKNLELTGLLDGITDIGRGAFKNVKIGNLTIPEGVKTIGDEAFFYTAQSANLKMIIPSTVVSIGINAFKSNYSRFIYIRKPQDSIAGAPWGTNSDLVHWNYTGA